MPCRVPKLPRVAIGIAGFAKDGDGVEGSDGNDCLFNLGVFNFDLGAIT